MMASFNGYHCIFVIAITLSALPPLVVPCSSGSSGITGTSTTTSTAYFRCLSSSSPPTVTCRTTCLTGETQLSSTVTGATITDSSLCAKTTFYELCYDFATDTSNTGTCTPDYVKACSGSTKKLIATVFNDTTCGKSSPTVSLLVKCTALKTNVITCRPQLAGCTSDESKDLSAIYFFTTSCYNLGSTGLYDICYDYTNTPSNYFGVCQPVETGCVGVNKLKLLSSVKDYICDANESNPTYGTSTTMKYIRCEVFGTTTVNCRPASVGSCKPDNSEIRVPDSSYVFDTLEYCKTGLIQGSTSYQWCYDFSQTTTYTYGTCKQQGTCTGSNQKAIGGIVTDPTCAAATFTNLFYQCMTTSNTVNCRPSEAGCSIITSAPAESQISSSLSLASCYSNKFVLCYDFNNANPQTAKCIPQSTICSGITITSLGTSTEPTCQNLQLALASSTHFSCKNIATSTELCRSSNVGCAVGTEQQSSTTYSSANDCYDSKTGLCTGGSSWGNCYCSNNCAGTKLYLAGFTDTKLCSSYCPVVTSATTFVRCTLICYFDPTGRGDIVRQTYSSCVPAVNCNYGGIQSLGCTAIAGTSYSDIAGCTATLT